MAKIQTVQKVSLRVGTTLLVIKEEVVPYSGVATKIVIRKTQSGGASISLTQEEWAGVEDAVQTLNLLSVDTREVEVEE